jgi:hypothetical protein
MTKWLVVALALGLAGCGTQSPRAKTTSPGTKTTLSGTETERSAATANPAAEVAQQQKAEAVFEREGLDYYIGVLRPSTVRFSSPCPAARKGRDGPVVPGKWRCSAWGRIAIEGSSGKLGECQLVQGEVTASGLVGKPTGSSEEVRGSTCERKVGLRDAGRKPSPQLVDAWTRRQQAEAQYVKEQEASPEAQHHERE